MLTILSKVSFCILPCLSSCISESALSLFSKNIIIIFNVSSLSQSKTDSVCFVIRL